MPLARPSPKRLWRIFIMADDLSLLLKIKGDSAGGKAAIADTRAAIAQLRATTTAEFGQIQNVSNKAFASISDNLNVFIGQRIPLVGGAFVRVSENLRNFAAESTKTSSEIAKFDKTLEGLATKTGKTSGELKTFLTSFVQLESQAKRDTAAIQHFGAAAAQDLIPQLEKAGGELSALAVASGESASGLAGVLAAMGPVGIAAVGIAVEVIAFGVALGVAAKVATGAAEALFELAKSAAGFRGELFDLSQQTGVEVETLNALEIAASKTGGSIESVAQSLVIFQGKLDEAQDSGSKAGKTFAELGISTHNTETAFRDALRALAAMPVGFHQTNEAAELFGRRGGKQVLAILKESHGDIDSVVSKLGDLARVTKEDAKIADDFNDILRDFHILWRGIGKEAIPPVLDALKNLASLLEKNQGAVKALGVALQALGWFFVTAPIEWLNGQLELLSGPLERVTLLWERMARAMRAIGVISTTNFGAASASVGAPTPLEIGGDAFAKLPGAKTTLLKDSLKASENAANKELETQRHLTENLRLDHERRGGELIEFYRKQQDLVNDRLRTLKTQIAAEREANEVAFGRGAIDEDELANRKRDLDLRAKKAQNARDEETARLKLEKDRALIDEEIKLRERLASIAETARKGELDRFKAAADRQATAQSEVLTKELEFLKANYQERIGIIQFELAAEGTSAERKQELLTEKANAERDYTDKFKALTRERIDALNEESIAGAPKSKGVSDIDLSGIGKIIEGQLGPPPAALDKWKELKLVAMDALQNMAQGIGGLIQQWVIYGNVGPNAIRKMIAAILATAAAQAAVEAIMQLAYAWKEAALASASLAVFDVRGAALHSAASAAHLTSAAVFGTVAGIAAVAGRLVAGNSFNQNEGGGSGSGGGSSSGGRSTSTTPATREADRRGPSFSAASQGGMTLTLRVPHGWLGDELRKDFDLNGYSRLLITSER